MHYITCVGAACVFWCVQERLQELDDADEGVTLADDEPGVLKCVMAADWTPTMRKHVIQ